ncbi:cupin domain-containing protein [Afifella pfennigii]|uniref:cupin domain-containing protein n=1 Tax=Afifella pfennigii TaxID=209897 RepID=UPI00054D9E7C|nr:cupin domain-containing protein [Afifella pfennigii]
MQIWKNGDAQGVTPPNHFGGLNVLDIVPFKRGFSVQLSKAPKGGGGELHHHDHWSQVFYILEGELTFDTGKERFTLTKGQSVLFEPGDPHYTINESDKQSMALVITMDHQ